MKITVSTVILMTFFGASSATPYPNTGSAAPIVAPSQGVTNPSPTVIQYSTTTASPIPSAICYPIGGSGSAAPVSTVIYHSSLAAPYPPIGSGAISYSHSSAPYPPIGSGAISFSYTTIAGGSTIIDSSPVAAVSTSSAGGNNESWVKVSTSSAAGSAYPSAAPTQVPYPQCPPGYTNVPGGNPSFSTTSASATDVAVSTTSGVPTPSGQSAQNLNAGNDKSTGGALNMGASLMGSMIGVVGAAALLI